MNTNKYCFILSLAFLSLFGLCWSEPDIYVFSDFGGGKHQNQSITDWQAAIELASEGWKLTNHPQIFINDGATPLDPVKAGAQLAAAFPYSGVYPQKKIKRIVIHVIDPGVGNGSQGIFGLDLFINENKLPFNGQEITFQLTKDGSKQKGDL